MKLKLNIQRFSSTNATTHYELSQYIGSDKPTYLVDYNSDMSKIDTGIYNAQSKANTNESSIGTLSSLTTEAQSNLVSAINEVDAHADTNAGNIATNTTNIATNTSAIGTLANLDTLTKSDLVSAINEVVNKFSFNYKNNLQFSVAVESGSNPSITQTNTRINSAYNSDGSIGKIYGNIELTGTGSAGTLTYLTITSNDTGLRPTSNITLDGCAFMSIQGSAGDYNRTRVITYTLKTDGTIELTGVPIWYNEVRNISFIADVIFARDFGDSPVTPV